MSKLRKVKLTNAVVLKEQEMKQVLGGYSNPPDGLCGPLCRCYDKSGSEWASSTYVILRASCHSHCASKLGSSYDHFRC